MRRYRSGVLPQLGLCRVDTYQFGVVKARLKAPPAHPLWPPRRPDRTAQTSTLSVSPAATALGADVALRARMRA
jgi:hypothetical protein